MPRTETPISGRTQPKAVVPTAVGNVLLYFYADLVLAYDMDKMELIPAFGGHLPTGRQAIVGGVEMYGNKKELLYHAVATINGERIPGKTGPHLVSIHALTLSGPGERSSD